MAPKCSLGLPKFAISIMNAWYVENVDNPYPSKSECEIMANRGNVQLVQVKKWFCNKRLRNKKFKDRKNSY